MPNNTVRASGEAMPKISRRRMLAGVATMSACGLTAIVPAAAEAAEPDSELIALGKEFEAAFAIEEAARIIGRETKNWDAWDAAYAKTNGIVKKIEKLPASSLAELRVKARCIQWCHSDDPVFHEFDNATTDLRLARQIVVSLLEGAAA